MRALRMQYVHYPVKSDELSTEAVDGFRKQLAGRPRPVFAHCASGKRSGAFLMMHIAAETGMTGEETIRKAEEMGFECDTPEARAVRPDLRGRASHRPLRLRLLVASPLLRHGGS